MFVDQDGQNSTSIVVNSNILDDDQPVKYILIKGCSFDVVDKTSSEMGDFIQDEFIVTFYNVQNPIDEVDTSNFSI